MKAVKVAILSISFSCLLSMFMIGCGCNSTNHADSTSIISEPVNFLRLDKAIEEYVSLDSAKQADVIAGNRSLLDKLRLIVSPEIDTLDHSVMLMWSTWPATVVFMPEVNRQYQSLEAEEKAVGEILARAKSEHLSLPYNTFASVTWGSEKSIILVDTALFISLNHYLGPLNEAYNGWPEYKRRLKTRDMIPVDITEAMLGTAYPVELSDNMTVLNLLVREGAIAVAKERLNPRAPIASVLGFTSEQLEEVASHEAFIWKRLVNDRLLYSTDAEIKSELFEPRPASRIISGDAPGRAVRFVGYKLVESYLSTHPDTSLSAILSPEFVNNAANVLKESGYNPM